MVVLLNSSCNDQDSEAYAPLPEFSYSLWKIRNGHFESDD